MLSKWQQKLFLEVVIEVGLLSFIVFYSLEITGIIKSTMQFSCFNHFQYMSIKCLVWGWRRDMGFEGLV